MNDLILSVVIPTYNRAKGLQTIFDCLTNQNMETSSYEIIFVNDGSSDDTQNVLESLAENVQSSGIQIKLLHQENQGQAVARGYGVAESEGQVLLFLDDDMEPKDESFLASHAAIHEKDKSAVVYGAILPPKSDPKRPAFEWFYERSIATMYELFRANLDKPQGQHFFSANVSISKNVYQEAGGFNSEYRHAEDREFGLRIQAKTNANFYFSDEASAFHNSTTGRFSGFVNRARLYGVYDYQMAMDYPDNIDLSPFHYIVAQNPIKSLIIMIAEKSKILSRLQSRAFVFLAVVLGSLKLKKPAIFCCSAVYITNYIFGLRSVFENVKNKEQNPESWAESYRQAKTSYIRKIRQKTGYSFWKDVAQDVRILLQHEEKPVSLKGIVWLCFGSDAFPILFTFRLRKLARKFRIPLVNRLLRLFQTAFYSIELGIDIELGHGVYFVHSLGTVVGGTAELGQGCVLMGNNTVGAAQKTESPTIGEFVVFGAGSRILGEITIGNRTKIGANAVVLSNIPSDSVAVGAPAKVVKKLPRDEEEMAS